MVRQYENRDVGFLGLAHQDEVAEMADFVDRHGLGTIPHAVDENGALWAHFELVSQPNWLFVDDTGEVTTHQGGLDEAELVERVEALLRS